MPISRLFPNSPQVVQERDWKDKVFDSLLGLAGTTAGGYLQRKVVQEPMLEQKHAKNMEQIQSQFDYQSKLQEGRQEFDWQKTMELDRQRRSLKMLGFDIKTTEDKRGNRNLALTNLQKGMAATLAPMLKSLQRPDILAKNKVVTQKQYGKAIDDIKARKDIQGMLNSSARLSDLVNKQFLTEKGRRLAEGANNLYYASKETEAKLISSRTTREGIDPVLFDKYLDQLRKMAKLKFAMDYQALGALWDYNMDASKEGRVTWEEATDRVIRQRALMDRSEALVGELKVDRARNPGTIARKKTPATSGRTPPPKKDDPPRKGPPLLTELARSIKPRNKMERDFLPILDRQISDLMYPPAPSIVPGATKMKKKWTPRQLKLHMAYLKNAAEEFGPVVLSRVLAMPDADIQGSAKRLSNRVPRTAGDDAAYLGAMSAKSFDEDEKAQKRLQADIKAHLVAGGMTQQSAEQISVQFAKHRIRGEPGGPEFIATAKGMNEYFREATFVGKDKKGLATPEATEKKRQALAKDWATITERLTNEHLALYAKKRPDRRREAPKKLAKWREEYFKKYQNQNGWLGKHVFKMAAVLYSAGGAGKKKALGVYRYLLGEDGFRTYVRLKLDGADDATLNRFVKGSFAQFHENAASRGILGVSY